MIAFTDVSVEKNGVAILGGITVHLKERRVGIIGRNGSGKSTFARLFNGIEKPTSGRVALDAPHEREALRRLHFCGSGLLNKTEI